MFRIVIAPGQRLHRGEGGERHRVNRGFGAAGHHDVHFAGPDQLDGLVERFGSGGASGHRSVCAGPGTEVQAHGSGSAVGHEHGNGHRQHPPRSAVAKRVPGIQKRPNAADSGSKGHREPILVDLRRAGILPCFAGSDDGELAGRVQALGFDPGQHLRRRSHGAGGESHRELVFGDPIIGERMRSGHADLRILPRGRDVTADGGGGAESGDDYFAGHFSLSWVSKNSSGLR